MFDSRYFMVEWELFLNGSPLTVEQRYCINDIELKEEVDGSTTLNFVVQDPDYLYINGNVFIEDATVDLRMRVSGGMNVVTFSGYISAIDGDFPADGVPTLSIYCIDEAHTMNREDKYRSWDDTTSAEVVQKIAQENGLKCVIQEGYEFTKKETILQSEMTDIEFCEYLAMQERDLFMCKVEDGTLYYVKKDISAQPVESYLAYRQYPFNIMSYKPKVDKETQKSKETKANINTDTKKSENSVASNSETSREQNGTAVNSENFSDNKSFKAWKKYNTRTGKWDTIMKEE